MTTHPPTYYADCGFGRHLPWGVWKRTRNNGARRIACGMSEATARQVARLLNADEVAR